MSTVLTIQGVTSSPLYTLAPSLALQSFSPLTVTLETRPLVF